MAIKCLLLETKDKRRFFTLVKNKARLQEYCKTFKARMSVVKADIARSEVLDLEMLVPALCDKNHKTDKADFKVLKKL